MDKKILVIDDSRVESQYMEVLINKIEEVSADFCMDFDDAKEKTSKEKYNLILLDYYMVEGTGDTLIAEIRGLSDVNRNTPVVVMGKEIDFADEGFMAKNGFVNFLEKPVKFNMLKAVIALYAVY